MTYTVKENSKKYIIQKYDIDKGSEQYQDLEKRYTNLPQNLDISIVNNASQFTIKSPMYDGRLLVDIEKHAQNEYIPLILGLIAKYQPYTHSMVANIPNYQHIFGSQNNISIKLANKKYLGFIHGDLNPTNIIAEEKKCYLIDWDASGMGFIWFDILSLLTSPQISISLVERIEQFMFIFPEFNKQEINQIFKMFLKFKITQMRHFGSIDPEFHKLHKKYQHLFKLLNA